MKGACREWKEESVNGDGEGAREGGKEGGREGGREGGAYPLATATQTSDTSEGISLCVRVQWCDVEG